MGRAERSGRLNWQTATVVELTDETREARSVVLELPDWHGHLAGQHIDLRLTAEAGYQAQRSYSIASAPEDAYLVLTIQRLPDDEVSSFLHDELRVDDRVELRGPIGGYFVWDDASLHPIQLIAGGSGVVPFRSMLRHRAAVMSTLPVRLVYSARSLEDLIYHDELMRFAAYDEIEIEIALTRSSPAGWRGHQGRIDAALLDGAVWHPSAQPLVFASGPNSFVDAITDMLVGLGHRPERIRTERFGPTG